MSEEPVLKTSEPDPNDEDNALRQAEVLIERRRYHEAERVIKRALETRPDSAQLLYLSSFIDWARDDNDDARAKIERVLALQPEHYGARVLLGQLLEERKQHADAEQVWIGLLREFPEDPDVYGHYAALLLANLNVDKARRLALEGLRYDPEHESCLFNVALADLIEDRALGSNQNLETLIRAHPERLRTGLALVAALEDRGDNRQAHRVAQQLLRSRPDSDELVDLVRHFRLKTHWSMLPLYPVQRWGWTAALAMWGAVAFGLPLIAPGIPKGVVGVVTMTWLVYCVYSWVWPSILKRLV
jgi:tetratricopeptide (TPR) repeat protein